MHSDMWTATRLITHKRLSNRQQACHDRWTFNRSALSAGLLSGFCSQFSEFQKIISRVRENRSRIETGGLDYNPTKGTARKRFGADVSSSLKPSLHCIKAAAKAMLLLGITKRNFVTNDEEDFCLLFNGYVRPHLEYCVQFWSPYLKKDTECLEKVHRKATKLVKALKNGPHADRLAVLHSSLLVNRRFHFECRSDSCLSYNEGRELTR